MTTELTAYLSTRCVTPSVFLSHRGLKMMMTMMMMIVIVIVIDSVIVASTKCP